MNQILLTQSEKISIGIKEITKRIRDQLKQEFKGCDFSVVKESYSMGCSIHISLMKANFKVIKDFSNIPEEAFLKLDSYTREDIKKFQEERVHQLNCYFGDYDPTIWSNGIFLTEKGFNLFKRIVEISNQYNWNNSDSQIDYFDVLLV